jgi:hypothetical protein
MCLQGEVEGVVGVDGIGRARPIFSRKKPNGEHNLSTGK